MKAGPEFCISHQKSLCCGCTACMSVCPVGAIHMEADHEGFLYPILDEALCIGCHRCETVCPFGDTPSVRPTLGAWAAVHTQPEVLNSSSSGGAFTAFAASVLEQNGLVCGAVLEKNRVLHRLSDQPDMIARMRGSKYVQSDLGNSISELIRALRSKRPVLFSGTPCQCAAVRKTVGEHDLLTTVDFVCHGVPSPEVWSDYVSWREKTSGSPLNYLSLRAKLPHKMGYFETYTTEDGALHHTPAYDSPYLTGFLNSLLSRPSCYACPYARQERAADLTICDYWGYSSFHHQFDPAEGISAVLVNTPRGQALWADAAAQLRVHPTSPQQVAAHNANLNHTSEKPALRDAFFSDRASEPFDALAVRYLRDPQASKKRLIAAIPYPVKNLLKKIRRNFS